MSNELADRLAVAAGWVKNCADGCCWRNDLSGDVIVRYHPFPVGRIDPILDLMGERGLNISGIFTPSSGIPEWDVFINGHKGKGPDLWTALATAVLAAMEKKE